jgi:periplasmic protein TonB
VRVYTLALSIVVHVGAVIALIVVPLVATDVLPEPWRAVQFITVGPLPIEPPPPPVPREAALPPPAPVSSDAAPVEVPDGIAPEPPDTRPPVSLDAGIIDGGPLIGDFAPDAPLPPPTAVAREPLPVGGLISRPERIRYVAPVYPPIARAANVEGVVIVEAVLGVDGRVRQARVLRSAPLLDAAAIAAVEQWQFTPTLLNGQAVPVVMTVTVVFSLR